MRILPIESQHAQQVICMMRTFYASDAVSTNGSEEIFANNVRECLSDSPYAEGYVFEEDGAIIGYGMLAKSYSTEFGKPCVWIEDIYFKPQYRGRGYAGKFFEFVEEKHRGALLRLELEKSNEAALKAYLKHGFSKLDYLEMKK